MGIHLTGHVTIPSEQEKKETKIKPADLKDVFSDGIPAIAKEDQAKRRTQVKDITPENLCKLESIDIKDQNWEQVKPSNKIADTVSDLRAIKPSRSENETNDGGTGLIPGSMDFLFNKQENSDYTKHVLDAGTKKREKNSNRGKPSQEFRDEWEVVAKAKNTSEVPVTDRGVMPNRSSFEPVPLPKVKISTVDKIKEKNKQSAAAGIKAAELKTELDNIMREKQQKTSGNWEEEALGNIKGNATKKITVSTEKVKFAKDFTAPGKSKTDLDFSGIFATPENPATFSEKEIRRNADKLKVQRTKREDDRSWEAVIRSSKTKRI